MIEATVGYSADERGAGVAYVELQAAQTRKLIRVCFTVARYPALLGREIGYAAMAAVVERIVELGCFRVAFHLNDAALIEDLRERRDVPAPLTLSYVTLRCALNRLADYHLADGGLSAEGLNARARAEVALHVAA